MKATNRQTLAREEKQRRKRLIRKYREIELATAWDKIADEVGPCDASDADRDDWYTFDYLDRVPPSACDDPDEDYPNKIETISNIYECD